jgi:serine/threonine protein kinase/tetratricopeptide (TPR) repeat protein
MANEGNGGPRLIGDRFQLLGRLGGGSAGTVFAARDRTQGRTVALKRLRDADPRGVFHFKREFRALADASHPNLVTLHELFVDGCDFYLSMELVHGLPISEYLRPGISAAGPAPFSVRREIPTRVTADLRTDTRVGQWEDLAPHPPAPLESAKARVPSAAASPKELDWERIRRTFAQLADALLALHEEGIFHRDLKPSNVLVDESGRVVVLDFGLIAKIDSIGQMSPEHSIVGTPAYMAPETCSGKPYEEASDWFSVGVMLFEVLAGELPHHADNLPDLIHQKLQCDAADAAALNPAVPDDLATLCHDLLQRQPSARPRGSELRRRLGHAPRSAQSAVSDTRRALLEGRDILPLGRDVELSALRDALAGSRAAPVLVRVDGVSGMGKSTLVTTFLERIVRKERALVLRGRCYQHEFLHYKAIDGVVDELSEYLARLAPTEGARLLPAHTNDLARVFPVVAQVPAVGVASAAEFQEDPLAVKRSAFAALRELLARIARDRALVIFVDDVQWGDLDSVDVLEELLRPPGAPPFLLVLAFRSEERETSPFLRALHARLEVPGFQLDVRDLFVCSLPPAASRELAQALLGTASAADADLVRRIAEESEGHPLLIEELVRHARSPEHRAPAAEPDAPGPLLTRVINRRVADLPLHLRALLDAVSLAGAPITADAACEAAGMDGLDQTAVHHLLARRLLRAHRDADRDEIAPYHDRIREAVVDSLPSPERRRMHRALGNALLRLERVPSHLLVTHFEGAGELAIAAKHAVAAAEQAAHALAFKEAAELYRKALTWDPGDPDEARQLRNRYADALFNQGLCRDAAGVYAETAESAPAEESSALRTRAALSFMTCGAVEEGAPLMRTVLREVGVVDPSSRPRAFLRLMLLTARLRLRGLGYRRRADQQIATELLRRIDTCYAAVHAYILHDLVRANDFLAAGLLTALKAGEPGRLVEGCALTGGFLASFHWAFADRLIATAERLADELDTPFARGTSHLGSALKCFVHDDWTTGLEHADAACALLNRCAGVTTLQQYAQIQRLLMLRSLERFPDIEVSVDQSLQWAREVGNPYFEAAAHLESVLPLLARDNVAGARARLGEALQRASANDGYVVHSGLTMRVKCDLYEGRWQQAHDHVEQHWSALRRGGMLLIPAASEFYGGLRAGAALEVAVRDPGRRDGARRVARKGFKNLERTQSDFGRGCRAALLAAMASDEDRVEDAVALCREASSHFARASLPVRAAALERRAAELEGAAAGIVKVDADMVAAGVVDPARWTRSVAPGFRTAGRQ